MKLKEIDRNGNIVFSPRHLNKTYLAVGTASQQLDASFNTTAQIEIFEYNSSQNGLEMQMISSTPSDSRLSKLLWNQNNIICGEESGYLTIYDSEKLINPHEAINSRISSRKNHNGSILSMDINKYKNNLLATGGAESDILIWDLEKVDEPMTPGQKTQPFEDVVSLSWNHKVQHILGSVSSHRCQIWDLRKTDPVIKLSDTQMKMKPKKILWHPEISTRLCLASSEDHTPVIQMWDLRYIQCPYHTLERHTKGIIDIEWCLDDPDLLISIGKDNQMIGFDMSTHVNSSNDTTTNGATVNSTLPVSDVVYEWKLDQQYLNEVKFCPKQPGIVAVSSFDCHIGLYSLLGGRNNLSGEVDLVNASFPMDLIDSDDIDLVKKEAEKVAEKQLTPAPYLKKAPKWLKRNCGARFGFGGKLVYFTKPENSGRSRQNSMSQTRVSDSSDTQHRVFISQIITEQQLLEKSIQLSQTIDQSDLLSDYCQKQINNLSQMSENGSRNRQLELNIWNFIECHFSEDSRSEFIRRLGYNTPLIDTNPSTDSADNSDDNQHNELTNGIHEDTEIELENINLISNSSETEHNLSVSLMTGDIKKSIELCLEQKRFGEAVILAVSSGQQDLYYRVQKAILTDSQTLYPVTSTLIHMAVKRDWLELVKKCSLGNWRETLTWLLTYSTGDELPQLCEILGQRLEDEQVNCNLQNDDSQLDYPMSACICYICAGSVDKFVNCFTNFNPIISNSDYHTIVEMIVLLMKSIGEEDFTSIKEEAVNILLKYSMMICQQGNIQGALKYLESITPDCNQGLQLKHRIIEHLRLSGTVNKLPFEFKPIFNKSMKSTPHRVPNYAGNVQKPPYAQPYLQQSNYQTSNSFNPIDTNQTRPPQSFNNKSMQPNPSKSFSPPTSQTVPPPLFSNPSGSMNCGPILFGKPVDQQQSVNPQMGLHNTLQTSPPSMLPPNLSNTFVPTPINNNISSALNTSANFMTNPQYPQQQMQLSQQHLPTKYTDHNPISAWNDPPVLSDNYTHEKHKNEASQSIQKFYNPAEFTPNLADINNVSSFSNYPASAYYDQSGFTVPPTSVNSMAQNLSGGVINNATRHKSGDRNSVISESDSIELPDDIKKILQALLVFINNCRQIDSSRQNKVKMDDYERKIVNWFNSLKTKSLSSELQMGLNGIIELINTNNIQQAAMEVNRLIQVVSFSEAGNFLPSLKMLLQNSLKLMQVRQQ